MNRKDIAQTTLRTVALLAFALTIVSCGGGGGGGVTYVNKPITDAQREVDLTAVNTQMGTLGNLPLATQAQDIVTFMSKMPDFEETGIAPDGSAWGRFTDGRFLICETTLLVGPPTDSARTKLRPETQLPTYNTSDLFNAFGTGFKAAGATVLADLAKYGYTASGGVQNPTVDLLKSIKNDGVFYIDSHGGYAKLRNKTYTFGVFSGTVQTETLDASYKADLDSLRMGYMSAPLEADSMGFTSHYQTDYAITSSFVTQYMKFGPDSLVFVNTCSSADAAFTAACISAGAGYYVGWTKPVNDTSAYDSAAFLFDRLLGIDMVAPVDNPVQPPYSMTAVASKMASTTDPNTKLLYTQSSLNRANRPTATLVFTKGPGDLANITPAIASIATNAANNTATLTGTFGSDQGTVDTNGTLGTAGTYLTVQSWSPTTITVTLTPLSTNAIVRVYSRVSNSKVINPYAGAYSGNYSGTGSDGSTGSGTFSLTIQASGNITGSATTTNGTLPLTGSIDSSKGTVQFGTGTNSTFRATFTGNFVIQQGVVSGSGQWSAIDTTDSVTESGGWATS